MGALARAAHLSTKGLTYAGAYPYAFGGAYPYANAGAFPYTYGAAYPYAHAGAYAYGAYGPYGYGYPQALVAHANGAVVPLMSPLSLPPRLTTSPPTDCPLVCT